MRYWCGIVAGVVCVALAVQARADADPASPVISSPLQSAVSPLVSRWMSHRPDLRVGLPRRSQVSRSYSPARWITLTSGDQFPAEIMHWDEQRIGLRLGSGQPTTIDRTAVRTVGIMPGELELLYEPFEAPSNNENVAVTSPPTTPDQLDATHAAAGNFSLRLTPDAGPWAYSFSRPLPESRVQFWVRVDATARFQCHLQFATGVWQLETTAYQARGTSEFRQQDGATCQDLAVTPGWHRITVGLFADHAFAALDDLLLISTARAIGPLHSLEFQTSSMTWIDNLQISQLQAAAMERVPSAATADDCLTSRDGTQWFGRVRDMDSRQVTIAGPGGDRSIPWSQVRVVELRAPDHEITALPVQGWWSDLRLQPSIDRRAGMSRLHAAITHADRYGIEVRHPFLGDIAFAWSEIAQIQLRFHGRRTYLHAGGIHLGNSIRADFNRPLPDGIEWTCAFELDRESLQAAGSFELSLDVAEMEPAHPETPPGSPSLKELRAGELLTEVLVNQQVVGALNRELVYRPPVGDPVTLRLRIPSQLLQVGHNTIQLRQRPLSANRLIYDNCEVSNLRLDDVPSDPPHSLLPQLRSSR